MISYCDFLSPQFIPFSELTGSPLLSQPPEATLDWHFGWARICKHEFAHLQGEAGRTFAVSKTMLSMEPFLTALEKRENFLGGRIYLIRFDLEVSSGNYTEAFCSCNCHQHGFHLRVRGELHSMHALSMFAVFSGSNAMNESSP